MLYIYIYSRSSWSTDQLGIFALRRDCKRSWKRLLPIQRSRTPDQLQSRSKPFVVAFKAMFCKSHSPIYGKSLGIMALALGEYNVFLCFYGVNLKTGHWLIKVTIYDRFFRHSHPRTGADLHTSTPAACGWVVNLGLITFKSTKITQFLVDELWVIDHKGWFVNLPMFVRCIDILSPV